MTNDHHIPKLTPEEKASFIQEVYSERKLLSYALDKKVSGIVDLLKQMYPDGVHFIYELLQNAEDVGATEVCFDLTKNCLGFEHNGKPFSQEDVRSITTVAVSSKSNSEGSIGRFGIGFRSVFEYTSVPKIWSPTYSFAIENSVLPILLPDRQDLDKVTRFEFPFNNPTKSPECAFGEISKKLREITEDTLLFLNRIISIEWKINEVETGSILRLIGNNNHVEVMKQINSEITSSSHFLLFSKPTTVDNARPTHHVSIAYALKLLPGVTRIDEHALLSEQVKIVPTKGNVAVFFPAVKESSGLHFHLHAPFVSVPSRDSIKDTEENNSLFTDLADLCCKSLHEIRDARLLTRDFFRVLPSSKDPLGDQYTEIRERIIQEFDIQSLMPTYDGGYAPARALCQARESLKDLLSKEDLRFLGNFDPDLQIDWAVNGDIQGTEIERFMSSTAIRNWGIDQFIEVLSTRLNRSSVSKSHLDWLQKKPMDWLQMFYNVLSLDSAKSEERLTQSVIVKLADGEFSIAKGSYFPNANYQHSKSMPCIDVDIIRTKDGKFKPQNRRLLEKLGVVEIDEFQLIRSLLDSYYSQDDVKLDFSDSVEHLQKFIQVLSHESDRYSSIFSKYRILYGHDKKWHRPCEIFIDSPFEDTDMLAYHRLFNEPKNLAGLSVEYFNANIDNSKLISFATSLGAMMHIPVVSASCQDNPNRGYLVNAPGAKVSKAVVDQDWHIKSFNQMVDNINLSISKLILKSIKYLEDRNELDIRMRAKYCKSLRGEPRQDLSQLACQLRDGAWIPQARSLFVKPSEAKYEELPSDFVINHDSLWVRHVNFGNDVEFNASDKQEKDRKRKEAFKTLGFNPSKTSELELLFEKLAEFPFERISDLIPGLLQEIENSNTPFPGGDPVRGKQRGERVDEEARGAPDRVAVKRVRSVHKAYPSVKGKAKQYLGQQYTKNGNMFCQICQRPMPFKLNDDSPFVMKVEFLRDCEKRHFRNHLSLCPNHAAMFIHTNHDRDNLRDMVRSMEGLELQISLAQSSFTIRFTEQHIHDIKKIMESDRGSSNNDDLDTDEDD